MNDGTTCLKWLEVFALFLTKAFLHISKPGTKIYCNPQYFPLPRWPRCCTCSRPPRCPRNCTCSRTPEAFPPRGEEEEGRGGCCSSKSSGAQSTCPSRALPEGEVVVVAVGFERGCRDSSARKGGIPPLGLVVELAGVTVRCLYPVAYRCLRRTCSREVLVC